MDWEASQNDLELQALSQTLIEEQRSLGRYVRNGCDWLSVEVAAAIQWHDPAEIDFMNRYMRGEINF